MNSQVVLCEYISSTHDMYHFLPPAIPKDMEADLTRLHDAPFVWFIGHLTAYLMRPDKVFEKQFHALLRDYKLHDVNRSPVLGIHVRRTDKINTEAQFHHLEEYMLYADRRFEFWETKQQISSRPEWNGNQHEHTAQPIPRRIFLASDDPSVIKQGLSKFPNYEFFGDISRAQSAAVSNRMTTDSITGIALDILLLSRTDFLVCTFSSQVCRVSYELMQTRHAELGDASRLFQSLDDSYYFGGQQANPNEAVVADTVLKASAGDLINIAGNHWDGYAKVELASGGPSMIRPAFRFRPRVLAVEMYNYSNI